jgi:hypothetical protein
MDCLKLLVIVIISAAAVTGFQLSSSLGKFKILSLGALLERKLDLCLTVHHQCR